MKRIKIFRYIEELDAFLVTDEYRQVANRLGLSEWHPVVWIGRLFTLDNDFGEHWFDNWTLREEKARAAERLGIASEALMVIDPERFKDDRDGPCHPAAFRKAFWTDVLISLELSYSLLFEEARQFNENIKELVPQDYIKDLEQRIHDIKLKASI